METDIFVISEDGRRRRRLTNDPSNESDLRWSPTGTQIAYRDGVAKSGAGDIFVTDRSGGPHRRLTRTEWICEYPTGWSRNGRWVHVSTCITSARSERRATDGKRRPASAPRGSLSPDGRSLAYLESDDNASNLFVADADGKNPRRIAELHHATLPEWSPDSRWLAFEGDARDGCGAAEYRTQIFVIAPQPNSQPIPRDCTEAWERRPTWQPVRR
jgi:Tol biopolymer transport system component